MGRGNGFRDWKETLALKRRVNASNVFILETDDPKRLQELLAGDPPLAARLTDKATGEKPAVYYFDMQRNAIRLVYSGDVGASEAQNLVELMRLATQKPVTIIISWVAEKRHASGLTDLLLAAAHDERLYRPMWSASTGSKLSSTLLVLTFDLDLFPPSIRKFMVEIEVPPSTEQEREHLIKSLKEQLESLGLRPQVSADAVRASAGLTLHELETAVLESVVTRGKIDADTFRSYKVELLRRWGLEYVEPTRGFESVAGYNYLKDFLKREVILFYKKPKIAEMYGLTPPRGLLLFGPPGTGKTWLTRALAREMGLPMVKLSAADILRGIVGESEQRARRIARLVESMAPVVVFIDEADQLFRSRATTLATDSGVSQRVQNILLDWLGDENRRSFIVLATNFPEQLDWAAVRAGRIDYAVPVLLPDTRARAEILRYHFEHPKPRKPVNVSYNEIAVMTRGWTPAELAQLARASKLLAAQRGDPEILTDHVIEALDIAFKINTEERITNVRRMIEQLRTNAIVRQDLLTKAMQALTETVTRPSRLESL